MGRFSDIPYQDRTDAQKAETQWGKALGLLRRNDWSAAIVRAVTATEISLNLAIRREHAMRGELALEQVNQQLLGANGIARKISILENLLDNDGKTRIRALRDVTTDAANKRNRIVHSGEFCNEDDARAHVESCRVFVNAMIQHYEPQFELARDEIMPEEDPGA